MHLKMSVTGPKMVRNDQRSGVTNRWRLVDAGLVAAKDAPIIHKKGRNSLAIAFVYNADCVNNYVTLSKIVWCL